MTPAPTFRDEVLNHLDDDILSFGWLRQMAERDFGYPIAASRRAVIEMVFDLVQARIAVVGSAQSRGGMVIIQPWSEKGEALIEKMNQELDAVPPEECDWVFWLQLLEHYNGNEK